MNKNTKKQLHCNGCGRTLSMEGANREDVLIVEKEWGYFSRKDGELHRFCLCEDCYDRIKKNFAIPVKKSRVLEYL